MGIIKYKILKSSKIIVVYYKGVIFLDDVISNTMKRITDVDWDKKYNVIHDFRDCVLDISVDDIGTFNSFFSDIPNFHYKRKLVMLTMLPNQVVLTTLFLDSNKEFISSIFSTLKHSIFFLCLSKQCGTLIRRTLRELKSSSIDNI